MKTAPSSVFTLLLLTVMFASCKKDESPASPAFSIENKVTAARPYNLISITGTAGGNWTFERGGTNPLNDAYAENGYFIVVSSSTHYFNLQLAKNVFVGSNRIAFNTDTESLLSNCCEVKTC
jgi:hypothetical protein